MKPRRTHRSTSVYRLPGGTEDNDLWVRKDVIDGCPAICSTWVPTDEERQAIADGANIELAILGTVQPPVSMILDTTPLGRTPDAGQ